MTSWIWFLVGVLVGGVAVYLLFVIPTSALLEDLIKEETTKGLEGEVD